MKKIALMCDSSADISKKQAEELDIYVVRMPIIIDGKEYIEEETIEESEIIKALREGVVVKTAQPIIGDLTKMWDELLKEYDEVFYIPLTYSLSGTCQVAIQLAEAYEGRVTVLNSEFVCYPTVKMLLTARDMFGKGYTCAQVKEIFERDGELLAILVPETLTALKNGGRISPAAAALAGLLKIQPLLNVKHGAIDLVDKVRTLKKAYKEGISYVLDGVDPVSYTHLFAFDKFPKGDRTLGTQMKATGEVMSIGRTFDEAILKAIRSLEMKVDHLEKTEINTMSLDALWDKLKQNDDERIFVITAMIRKGVDIEEIFQETKMDRYFLYRFRSLVAFEKEIAAHKGDLEVLLEAKKRGFADSYIARVWDMKENEIYDLRKGNGITPVYKVVDTCAGEYVSTTPYLYSTYEHPFQQHTIPALPQNIHIQT